MKDLYWLNADSRKFLDRGYLPDGESPEKRMEEISKASGGLLSDSKHGEKLLEYKKKGFYSFSSPVWSNFGNKRGLPVSCFGSYIPDSIEGMLLKQAEIGIMSKMGGGTSAYFGDVRPRGSIISSTESKADGPVRYMELYDRVTEIISQGGVRRGSFAAYLPVEHPDIMEFLEIREEGHAIQNMSIGVTITDKWMEDLVNGNSNNRKIWARIIKKRYETGYPYITYIDNCNNNTPEYYEGKIKAQNLCNEIALPSDDANSFVCVLSSLNLLHWDEIKETDAVETLVYFLDSVNEEFVRKTEGMKFMEHPHNFAKSHRALGMGVLGWHSYLQSKMIPFESFEAKMLNTEIFREIRNRADNATLELGKKFGEAPACKGTGRRNTTTIAIAPTTSSSFILGQVSPSIEPLNGNYFVKKLAKGNFTYKNPFLKDILKEYKEDNKSTWDSILIRGGSVQHLDFLPDNTKNVFKTFGEISQKEIVIQAAQRQKYIDQGQSLNIMIPPKTPPKQVSELLIEGWKMGIKGFYYQRSANPAQELSRDIMNCVSCEG